VPIRFTSSDLTAQLSAVAVADAITRSEIWLTSLTSATPGYVLSGYDATCDLKTQLLQQLGELAHVPAPEALREASLLALSCGLLCGGLDGAVLYVCGLPPQDPADPHEVAGSLLEGLAGAIVVADRDWRSTDADSLQLLSGYGKHLNSNTVEENLIFLERPDAGPQEVRKALLETFRTGYCIGLVDAAIVFIAGEAPGAPPPQANDG